MDIRFLTPSHLNGRRFQIVFLDPPWKFNSNSAAKPGRNPMRHYDCMTVDEVRALPVDDFIADQALLFMWTTAPLLRKTVSLPEAWGCRYVTNLVWVKDRVGLGFWSRNRHEHVLVYKRGAFPRPYSDRAPFDDSVFADPRGRHSQKPESLQDRIDELWPQHSKLELFARRQRSGWITVGNQIEGV